MLFIADMKNSADQGGCYPRKPKAKVDNTLQDLQNSSYPTKAEFSNCLLFIRSFSFPLTKYNTTLSPGFLGQRFNDLQRAALLTSLVQYDKGLSRFGQQQMVMVNYVCYLNQFKTGKYFE